MGVVTGPPGPPLETVAEIQRDRSRTILEMAEKSRFAYEAVEAYEAQAAKKFLRPVALEPLLAAREHLNALPDWEPQALQAAVEKTAEDLGLKLGKLAQPLRVALTGTAASPGIEKTLLLVGRERSLARVDAAVTFIRTRAAAA